MLHTMISITCLPTPPPPWFLIFNGMSATTVSRQVFCHLYCPRASVNQSLRPAAWSFGQEYCRLCHSVRSVSFQLLSAHHFQSVFVHSKFFQVTKRSFPFFHKFRSPKYTR